MGLNYIGNDKALSIGTSFIKNWNSAEPTALILCGPPGTGKTYLTHHLAKSFQFIPDIFNASSSRTKEAVKKIYLHSQMAEPRIIILDECEGLYTSTIKKLIKDSKHPIILCCNFIEEIDYTIKDLCKVVYMNKPPWWTFKKYMKQILDESEDTICEEDLNKLAKKATSFRHANRLLDDPEDDGAEYTYDKWEQVEYSLRGWGDPHFTLPPDELIHWINDNSYDNPKAAEIISQADIFIERAYLTKDYHFWKYAYRLLRSIRSDSKIQYPFSFVLMGKAKKAIKEGKSSDLIPEIKIDLTTVDFSVLEDEDAITKTFYEDTPSDSSTTELEITPSSINSWM